MSRFANTRICVSFDTLHSDLCSSCGRTFVTPCGGWGRGVTCIILRRISNYGGGVWSLACRGCLWLVNQHFASTSVPLRLLAVSLFRMHKVFAPSASRWLWRPSLYPSPVPPRRPPRPRSRTSATTTLRGNLLVGMAGTEGGVLRGRVID